MTKVSTVTGTTLPLDRNGISRSHGNCARNPELDPQVTPSGSGSPDHRTIGLSSAAAFWRAAHRLVVQGICSNEVFGSGLMSACNFSNRAADNSSAVFPLTDDSPAHAA